MPTRSSTDTARRTPITHHDKQSRKQDLLTHGEPATSLGIADAIVIKDEDVFFLSPPDGCISVDEHSGFGLYYHDCRYLNGYEFKIAGEVPMSLTASARRGYMAVLELTNPDLKVGKKEIKRQQIGIRWERTIDARECALHERIAFQNFTTSPIALPVSLKLQCGFEDIFDVRNLLSERPGTILPPRWSGGSLIFQYNGADKVQRALVVVIDPVKRKRKGSEIHFTLKLPARGTREIGLSFNVFESKPGEPMSLAVRSVSRAGVNQLHGKLHRATEKWIGRHTQVLTTTRPLQTAIHRSLIDLRMLRGNLAKQEYFSAGVPWFATLFGRDSIITGLQTLAFEPYISEQTLRLLARYQGKEISSWHDEQPGKILHELRVGELARTGEIPHTPYYGSIDATPLFLILVAEHARWSGSLKLFRDLRLNIEAALRWMSEYADPNRDGYMEYNTGSSRGLVNQGWKDSGDGIVDDKGALAKPPISLAEVQGYAYRARLAMADLFERSGEHLRAKRLRRDAAALRRRFNRDFWLKGKRIFAMALESRNRALNVVSSNAGQVLWTGIADAAKAKATARRLFEPDMFNGWGVRTLASSERGYNPVSYHRGTVWPHDNALIAAGLRRYGLDDEAMRIFTGILQAASFFTNFRLPEVFSGFNRPDYDQPVRYPVACHPQAWAAGSIPMMLASLVGLDPDGLNRRLRIVRPVLPEGIDDVELRGLRVADAEVDLRFERNGKGHVKARVLAKRGELNVSIEPRGKF